MSIVDEKLNHLDKLKNESKTPLTQEKIRLLESEIQNCCAAENAKLISEQVGNLSTLSGTFSSHLMYNVKRKVCARKPDPPMAKRDVNGNLITAPNQLKHLYLDEYIDRLLKFFHSGGKFRIKLFHL